MKAFMQRSFVTLLHLLLLTGCSSVPPGGGADSHQFQGLDPDVVAEVLNSPVATQKLVEEPEGTRASLGQGMVRNYIVCRDALRVYRQWLAMGQRPDLAGLPAVDNPAEPSNQQWVEDYVRLEQRAESGDPAQLREWLTAAGSCGQWIPAQPGDVAGPTIADVVEGA